MKKANQAQKDGHNPEHKHHYGHHHHQAHHKHHYHDLSANKAPKISIFIKNEVKQDGQHQEQKQDKKDESQNGCMAWVKSLCK